jgi:DNA-binding response OmpR family regulator
MNILYLENHSVFAANAKQQFLSNHVVTVVPSLSAARQAIRNGTFDLLLVDYDLDDGKGDDLVREISTAGQHQLIIGVSSHDEGNIALLKAGAIAVCSKMQFDRIQAVIDSITGENAGERE